MKKSLENTDGKLDAVLFGDVEEAAIHLNPNNLPHIDKTDVRQARMEVLENYVMDGYGGVVGEYAELVIQFAFTTLFACAFPGAPMIVLLINIIGIRGEMFVNLTATQRPETKSAPGIVQAWSNILEIMGYMAILVNLAILVVTFDMELGHTVMVSQNMTLGPREVLTSNNIKTNATWTEATEMNIARDWWWYLTGHVRMNELWAIVALEHVLIILKMCLGACIEDKPSWVVEAKKRDDWEDERLKEIAAEKMKGQSTLTQADVSDLANSDVLTSIADFTPAPPKGPAPIVGEGFLPGAKEEAAKEGAERESEKVGE